MAAAFGSDRSAAVARELTKTHEQVLRGSLGELADWAAATEVLGEIVIVVAGAEPVTARAEDLIEEVLARASAGDRLQGAPQQGAHPAPGATPRALSDLALPPRAHRRASGSRTPPSRSPSTHRA